MGNLDGRLPGERAIADACDGRRELLGPDEPPLVNKHRDVHPPAAGCGAAGEQVVERESPERVHLSRAELLTSR